MTHYTYTDCTPEAADTADFERRLHGPYGVATGHVITGDTPGRVDYFDHCYILGDRTYNEDAPHPKAPIGEPEETEGE